MNKITLFDEIFKSIEFKDKATMNVGGNIITMSNGDVLHYTWNTFTDCMERLMIETSSLAIYTKPVSCVVCKYNNIRIIVETSFAHRLLDESFWASLTEGGKRSTCIIRFEPLSVSSTDESTHVVESIVTTPVKVTLTDEKQEQPIPTPKEKLNSSSADKIKSIMQQTMKAVANSKDVPLEINENPYIEPPSPINVKTVEQQHKEQDKVMADLAKQLEQAKVEANTIDLDPEVWEDE